MHHHHHTSHMKFVFHSNCQRVFWGREKRVNEENFFWSGKSSVAVLHIKQAQKSSKRDLPTKMGTGIFSKKMKILYHQPTLFQRSNFYSEIRNSLISWNQTFLSIWIPRILDLGPFLNFNNFTWSRIFGQIMEVWNSVTHLLFFRMKQYFRI